MPPNGSGPAWTEPGSGSPPGWVEPGPAPAPQGPTPVGPLGGWRPSSRRQPRTPLPVPSAPRATLALELSLVLLFAFLPGLPGLLLALLGASAGSSGGIRELTPAIVFSVIDLALAWGPVALLGYLLVRSGEGRAAIGLGRLRPSDLRMGAALWVGSWVLVYVVGTLLSGLGSNQVDFLPKALPLWFRVVDALVIAVTAGVTEEVVVRGYAQTRLEQLRAPTAVVILLPTGLWGLLHLYQGLGPALTILCLGLAYAAWFHATRRLWPLVLAHALFDLTQLVLILLLD